MSHTRAWLHAFKTGKGDCEVSLFFGDEPESGVFLRDRAQYLTGDQFNVLNGIEAIFAPMEEALALEQELRERAVATLAVSAGGRARIKSVQVGI